MSKKEGQVRPFLIYSTTSVSWHLRQSCTLLLDNTSNTLTVCQTSLGRHSSSSVTTTSQPCSSLYTSYLPTGTILPTLFLPTSVPLLRISSPYKSPAWLPHLQEAFTNTSDGNDLSPPPLYTPLPNFRTAFVEKIYVTIVKEFTTLFR